MKAAKTLQPVPGFSGAASHGQCAAALGVDGGNDTSREVIRSRLAATAWADLTRAEAQVWGSCGLGRVGCRGSLELGVSMLWLLVGYADRQQSATNANASDVSGACLSPIEAR